MDLSLNLPGYKNTILMLDFGRSIWLALGLKNEDCKNWAKLSPNIVLCKGPRSLGYLSKLMGMRSAPNSNVVITEICDSDIRQFCVPNEEKRHSSRQCLAGMKGFFVFF